MTTLNDETKRPGDVIAPACTAGFQKSGDVNPLLAAEPTLAEFYNRDVLDAQVRALTAQVAALLISQPELAARYTADDLGCLAREFAAKLLSAARVRQAEKGI